MIKIFFAFSIGLCALAGCCKKYESSEELSAGSWRMGDSTYTVKQTVVLYNPKATVNVSDRSGGAGDNRISIEFNRTIIESGDYSFDLTPDSNSVLMSVYSAKTGKSYRASSNTTRQMTVVRMVSGELLFFVPNVWMIESGGSDSLLFAANLTAQ